MSTMGVGEAPIGKFWVYAGRAWILLTFGMVPELLVFLVHVNTYVLYLVGPPAMLGVVAAGGIPRTLKSRAAWYWLLFFVYMVIATPFSSWVSASVGQVMDYARFCLPLLFVVAGLTVTWGDVRAYFYTIGFAGLITVLAARFFSIAEEGRITLASSASIGNSNDLSSHLVVVLPFLLFIATDSKTKSVLKIPLFAAAGYSVWVILGTASRGALIALGVMFLVTLIRASAWQRFVVLILGLVVAVSLPLLLPAETVMRLASLFGGEHEEALESQESRSYLLQQSLIYTLQHPMFGIGPDQFPNYEGKVRAALGERGEWHETHNAFTQISSECGVPAVIFFVMGIGSALLAVNRTWRRARQVGATDISRACFFYTVGFIGYLVSITFLANAYRFYLPSMIGLAIAIHGAGNRYMDRDLRPGGTATAGSVRPA